MTVYVRMELIIMPVDVQVDLLGAPVSEIYYNRSNYYVKNYIRSQIKPYIEINNFNLTTKCTTDVKVVRSIKEIQGNSFRFLVLNTELAQQGPCLRLLEIVRGI